jgi:hypothetical protein
MCFILSLQVLHLVIQFPSRGMVQMSSARLHCKKARIPSLRRYAEDCEEPISRIIGLMVLVGQNNCRRPCLMTAIRTLRQMFS